jgi:hypothetical protein
VVSANASAPDRHAHADESRRLAEVLLSSLETLAAAGQAEAACRLAGRACAAVRQSNPAAWQRFNVFLHRMIKHVS